MPEKSKRRCKLFEINVLECLPNKEAVDLLDKALKGEKYEYLSVGANDI